jgi:hypothetical protein
MDIPRFAQHQNPGFQNETIGNAFQEFAHELLRSEYPGLHFFEGGGKDGCIDLIQDLPETPQTRLVVECKHIGEDGLDAARRRWRGEVASNLRNHLARAEGATERQYAPWYRKTPAISRYVFCISSLLSNPAQHDLLRDEIAGFFAELATTHAHLAHLANVAVTILDWSDLSDRLRDQPPLLFRWFKLTRHFGLATLDEIPDYSTFRSYLFSDKLPYYPRRQHLNVVPAPPDAEVPDEDSLLNQLDGDHFTGLVVTGSGGIGKTRLTLEIGRLAQEKDWLVLRVLTRLKEDALDHLARFIKQETRVLLLIDYVETQRDFVTLVDTLNDLNDSIGFRLRYVANCRTTYYQTLAATSRHRKVDLSPALVEPSLLAWFESYQYHTVRHILESSGVEVTESHLKVCRDIPILAVFISYLHRSNRTTELEQLLAEEDFTRWLVRRLQQTFDSTEVSTNLAQLVALFPIPPDAVKCPELQPHRELFNRLATDGWIEKLPADETRDVERWEAAHDLLADRILLSYLESVPRTIENFVYDLFSLARRVGCLRSALTALQRLADQLKTLDWQTILNRAIAEDPAAWRNVRDLLIRTPLLTYLQKIDLLGAHEEVWRGAEEEMGFQLGVGWLTRWTLDQKGVELNETQRSTLTAWLQKMSSHATASNYALTSGIKFCPEAVREDALSWIHARPRVFQTHFLMVAWLEQGLPAEPIASSVGQWALKFSILPHLSFIVRAWLKAAGDKEILRAPIKTWLALHATDSEANFVYRAWLAAGGEIELVTDSIAAWLALHAADAEAGFVYQPWLAAGGEIELVKDSIVAWLALHATDTEAQFVYRAWLDAGGDIRLIQASMVTWLIEHKDSEGADFLYRGWLDQRFNSRVSHLLVREARDECRGGFCLQGVASEGRRSLIN